MEAIEWRRGAVTVSMRSALHDHRETLHAPRVVITVPLGVLQAASKSGYLPLLDVAPRLLMTNFYIAPGLWSIPY